MVYYRLGVLWVADDDVVVTQESQVEAGIVDEAAKTIRVVHVAASDAFSVARFWIFAVAAATLNQ